MPRSRKGRRSKVRTHRWMALASIAAVFAAIGLGRWIAARGTRHSQPPKEIAKSVPPLIQQFITAPLPSEQAPMPRLVPHEVAQIETELIPAVPSDIAPHEQEKPRGFKSYSLARRIDLRDAEALRKDLANAAEVGLATPLNPTLGKDLATVARQSENLKRHYPGSVIVTRGRPDMAGLPFRIGRESQLDAEPARNMNDLSKEFREAITKSLKGQGAEAAPDVEKLYDLLVTQTLREEPKKDAVAAAPRWRWNTPEAVPCIQQMIQAEGSELRRMSCELLGQIDSAAATEALVKWAVFDVDAGNRAAAVEALRGRDRHRVGALLMEWARYPWERAVEHACEAMVELGMKENIPAMAALLSEPDPDAPFQVKLPGSGGNVYYRREIVRVNHLKNCLMCHPASFRENEMIRGAVPDENRILPPPTTPAYYKGHGPNTIQVSATTTYLKQDFSLVQPVEKPGLWPTVQRFDYFISTRQVDRTSLRTYSPNPQSAFKSALRFALRELAEPGKEWDREWLEGQRKLAAPAKDERRLAAAQTYALRASPEVFIAFKAAEFATPIYHMNGPELAAMCRMFETKNPEVIKDAMTAYLEPLLDQAGTSERERIARLLALARIPDLGLGEFLGYLAAMRD